MFDYKKDFPILQIYSNSIFFLCRDGYLVKHQYSEYSFTEKGNKVVIEFLRLYHKLNNLPEPQK